MNSRKTSPAFLLSVTVLLAMLANGIWTIPVRADSSTGTPPANPPSSGTGSSRKAKGSPSDSLSQVPSGTEMVLVDNQGNKVPLGSEEAQQIVNSGDPIWCPSKVATPTPGKNGCTSPYTSGLDSLVSDINSGSITIPLVNGTIWIEGGSDPSSNAISLDSNTLSTSVNKNIVNFSLTLKGGWNGCTSTQPAVCSGGVTTSNASVFSVPISIIGWNNNVTLSDITINGATGDGLIIRTKKNITLTRVKSNDNTGRGANLDNCLLSSGHCTASGNVTIATGQFDSNQNGDGLDVTSGGTITVSNADASSNTGTCDSTDCTGVGAIFDNSLAAKPRVLTLSYANNTNNYSDGLRVLSAGAVILNYVTANYNGTAGTTNIPNGTDGHPLDGLGMVLQNSFNGATSKSIVTIKGSNQFTHNYFSGLSVLSSAAITASNLDAELNGGSGVSLVNSNAPLGRPSILLTSGNNSLYNVFTANAFDGLDVWSNGSIAVKNITANGNGTSTTTNGGVGAWLENDFTTAASPITLSGNNTFSGNYSCLGGTPCDPVTNPPYGGLTVFSNGAIKANNITASGDLAGAGADFDNSLASSAQPVTLTGVNLFTDNSYYDGLDIFSVGAITISNLNAIHNGNSSPFGYGAYLDNCQAFFSQSCFLLTSHPITLTGNSAFKYNGLDGLDVFTNGTIKLSSVSADSNSGTGVYLENGTTNFSSGVILTGTDFLVTMVAMDWMYLVTVQSH